MATLAFLTISPYLTILDDNGIPIPGAKIWTYAAGTSTLKTTYTNYDSGIPASNPVVTDSAGRCEVWLATDGMYKYVILDNLDNHIRTVDHLGSGGTGGTSLIVNTVIGATNSLKSLSANAAATVVAIGYRSVSDNAGGTFRWLNGATGGDDGETVDGNTTYTTGRWKRLIEGDCNPKWWGAYGTGSDPDESFFTNAIAYANSSGKALYLVQGNYLLATAIDFLSVPVKFDPDGAVTWTNFSPNFIPVITDRKQHFYCGSYAPVFPAGATANPRWFGAKGDNNPNDSLPINLAITSITTNGGVVEIDDGIYYCKDAIVPQPNVSIIGQGEYTVLKLSSPTGVTNALFEMAAPTDVVNRFTVSDVTFKSDTINAIGALWIAGTDIKIDRCCFDAWAAKAIQIGTNGTPTDIKNISITNNIIKDSVGIELQAGANITITGNSLINSAYAAGIVINPNSKQGLLNVTISNNHLTNCTIEAKPNSAASSAIGLIVTNNKVDGSLLDVGLSVSGTYSVLGQVVVNENSISLSKADSTGIKLYAGTDGVGSYTINNNNIQADLNRYGIFASGITRPLFVDGNSLALTGGIGVKETSVSDASYGTNMMIGAADNYDVSEPRWCTLGTNLRSQIDGDTTVDSNLIVTNNAYVNGSLYLGGTLGFDYNLSTVVTDPGGVFAKDISGNSVDSTLLPTTIVLYNKTNKMVQVNGQIYLRMISPTEPASVEFYTDVISSTRDRSRIMSAINVDGTNTLICPMVWSGSDVLKITRPTTGVYAQTPAPTKISGIMAFSNYPDPGCAMRVQCLSYGTLDGFRLVTDSDGTFGAETIVWTSTTVTLRYKQNLSTVKDIVDTQGTARETGIDAKWAVLSVSTAGTTPVTLGSANFGLMQALGVSHVDGVPIQTSTIPFLIKVNGDLDFYVSLPYEASS